MGVVAAGQRPFGAGAQLGLKVAHLGVGGDLLFQPDEARRVVVDLRQRLVDAGDALLDGLALALQLRLEMRHIADRVLVQQFFEAGDKSRQIVGLELGQHAGVLGPGGDAGIDLRGLELEPVFVFGHRADYSLGQPRQLLVVVVDPLLQPTPHVLLAAVAVLDAQALAALDLGSPGFDAANVGRMGSRLGGIQPLLGLPALLAGLGLPEPRLRLLGFAFFELGGHVSRFQLQRLELRRQRLEDVGCRFQPLLLDDQRRQFAGAAAPIEFAEVVVLLQLVQRLQSFSGELLLALRLGNALAHVGQTGLQPLGLALERRDLAGIAPTQHIAAAVVEAVPVVLLMPLARTLDLARARDRPSLAAELVLVCATGQVKALGNFALQPGVVRRVGLDRELARQ